MDPGLPGKEIAPRNKDQPLCQIEMFGHYLRAGRQVAKQKHNLTRSLLYGDRGATEEPGGGRPLKSRQNRPREKKEV